MRIALVAATMLVGSLATSAIASPNGVKIGILTCNVHSGWGYVLGSSKRLQCNYHPERGDTDLYEGRISKFGVDIGYTADATIVWNVIAPTSDIRAGALEGEYAGATAGATVGVGVGAHVLLGGFHHSIALQPVSFEGNTGLAVSAGVGEMSLNAVPPPQPVLAAYQPAQLEVAAPPPPVRHRIVRHHRVYHRKVVCGCVR